MKKTLTHSKSDSHPTKKSLHSHDDHQHSIDKRSNSDLSNTLYSVVSTKDQPTPFQKLCHPLLKKESSSLPDPCSLSTTATSPSPLKSILKTSHHSSRHRAKTHPPLKIKLDSLSHSNFSNVTEEYTSHSDSIETTRPDPIGSSSLLNPGENPSLQTNNEHFFKIGIEAQEITLNDLMKASIKEVAEEPHTHSELHPFHPSSLQQDGYYSSFSSSSFGNSQEESDLLKMSSHPHQHSHPQEHRTTMHHNTHTSGSSGIRNNSPPHHGVSSSSSESLGSVSLINGGAPGLSSNVNLFKRDSGRAIRHFQNQTTNQFIQRTIAAHLEQIQSNKSNVPSDRAFLEGMELGMQLNGFLNKLTRDSKDYVKDLLDGVANEVTQRSCYSGCNYCSNNSNMNTSYLPCGDVYGIESSVRNMLQNAQTAAFSTNFVRGCMQQAISKTVPNQNLNDSAQQNL
ncbi:hypothetical protein C9374_005000 [Naegleria lovaniensis]|uniref:Uncharacterized protein n=1 Tax=Naegleria lovaniensis TaxID=51637 RepID=A0AA88GR85_NAELO|nr:uncharacterized protein C9374_005000 [Naegleria lovaniensis]KAG2383033.1 hypothetical protein C9374_005000 [Naegleria lovaniensis]